MKIKKIKKLSDVKYKIEFEDAESIITYDNIILENNILLKKEIDSDLYIKLQSENGYYEIYNKVVKYIVTKLRCEKEIREYLKKYSDNNNLINKIINQLQKENLLNEERYIKAFIEDKINLTSWGPIKIEKELIELDMNENLIKEYLSKYDDSIFVTKIEKIINKKVKSNKKDSTYILRRKIESELYELGYSRDLFQEKVEHISINENSIIEMEFQKLYKKLSKKYNGTELKYQIKNKLYQKGFNIDEINNNIENLF